MTDELFILGAAIAVALVVARTLSRRFNLPEAILLVLLGLLVSAIPGVGSINVPPELVLTVFLPPLVYHAAFFSAPRETREDAVPIVIMAFSLTCVTALCVALAVGATVPGLAVGAALALGAAVAPTDPVAATSVIKRLGAPRRLVTILEGESLVNDGVALTMFALALTMLQQEITAGFAALELLHVVVGGLAYGLALAWVIGRLRPLIRDPGAQIVLSLATPFLAYIPAEHLGLSGVLATIVVGFYLGLRRDGLLQPASRLTGEMFWEVLVFLLESTLFVLLGLQILDVFHGIEGDRIWPHVPLTVLLVIGVVVGVRMVWTIVVVPLLRFRRFATIEFKERFVMGWAGIRGAITLAIALSIPAEAQGRNLLVFIAACVVLATLLGQAPTLAPLLRKLGMGESEKEMKEETVAREALLESALARIDELAADDEVDERTAEVYRQLFELRLDRVREVLDDEREPEHGKGRIRRELIRAQRKKLDDLYERRKISADARRKLAHELDLEERRRVSGTQGG
ncbi:Na+/H+ antiporter [Nonomuraea soli]|uniref:CPA1 family monovalent cation:H+ antiporter n=1 Tax=Nonomuraea soli TaxID=1032476 RepID=A0A7W0CLH4_9ACTN|nr:Na+/H+ antiporter [Nonomuraea soli]MBA2893397.1 CPA1 family monovalent cation:H+ antiporter [Nonomuraea soli]